MKNPHPPRKQTVKPQHFYAGSDEEWEVLGKHAGTKGMSEG